MVTLLLFLANFSISILVHKVYLLEANKKWDAPAPMIEAVGAKVICLLPSRQKIIELGYRYVESYLKFELESAIVEFQKRF